MPCLIDAFIRIMWRDHCVSALGCEVWCRSIALSRSPVFPTGPSVTFSPTGERLVNYHWSFPPYPCCHHFINPILISSDLDCLLSLTGEWPLSLSAFSLTFCQTVLSCSQYICHPQNHRLLANDTMRYTTLYEWTRV